MREEKCSDGTDLFVDDDAESLRSSNRAIHRARVQQARFDRRSVGAGIDENWGTKDERRFVSAMRKED